jgi:PTH1 family peptidyl-tRNA hydrolase
MVVDLLAERCGVRFSAFRARADVVSVPRFAGRSNVRVILAKPRSYMNESGGPVAMVRNYYDLPLDRVLVVHDELDLPYASLRMKQGGGDNGHNGLRSLTRSLGGPDYVRLRFGIGRPPGRMDPAAFVLKDFASTERVELALSVDRAADAVECVVTEGLVKAQNLFHATRNSSD